MATVLLMTRYGNRIEIDKSICDDDGTFIACEATRVADRQKRFYTVSDLRAPNGANQIQEVLFMAPEKENIRDWNRRHNMSEGYRP